MRVAGAAPSAAQVAAAREVVRWYVCHHFGSDEDPGLAGMFCDPLRVGAFAVSRDALTRGEPRALFQVLVVAAMFQRRQDVQILRILRGISSADARELTSASRLLRLARTTGCASLGSADALITNCDLAKERARGTCSVHPRLRCYLKRHTVLLKRYGHFGKVPTSIALTIRDTGARHLTELKEQVFAEERAPLARAVRLERVLSCAWRVSSKIASMFLSIVSNPDLLTPAPWATGMDWTHFVVIDSNVDLFLSKIGYSGPGTYDARRTFVQALARKIGLDELHAGLRRYNPRVVQQALYLFMSTTNRRHLRRDCASSCADQACPSALSRLCPFGAHGRLSRRPD